MGTSLHANLHSECPGAGTLEALLAGDIDDAALANLQPRHKTILKLHFARGVAVAELAVLYKVHRVSMSRWIADAKAEVFEFTRAAIRKEIPMRDSEFDSVLRLLKSEIDFKLSSLREDDVS